MPHNHMGCQSPRDYFTEQLLTILVCGSLAFVGIQMYLNDMLKHILAPQFHTAVLIGSIAVLVLVALRALAVWREAGELQPIDDNMSCQENHVHGAGCNHLTGLPTGDEPDANLMDDHGHSHDMSWVFARMLILVFPVALFALGIPNSGFSADAQNKMLGNEKALNLDPKVLEQMAIDPSAQLLKEEREPDGTLIRVVQSVPTQDVPKGLKIRQSAKYEIVADAQSVPSSDTDPKVLEDLTRDPKAKVLSEETDEKKKDGTLVRLIQSAPTPYAPTGLKIRQRVKYVLVPDEGRAISFNELNDAAFDADKRKGYAGTTALMEGRFRRLGDKEFTLYRLKMTCCGPDAVMLKVRILTPQAVNGFSDHDWVRVKGVIQFLKLPGQEQYAPVLRLADITDIQHAEVGNEYEF